jgi:hypothetical protein
MSHLHVDPVGRNLRIPDQRLELSTAKLIVEATIVVLEACVRVPITSHTPGMLGASSTAARRWRKLPTVPAA